MSKTVVLYHGPECADGFGAAWATWHALGDDVAYVPVNYGSPPPDEAWAADRLFIVDFSYDRPTLERLAEGRDILVLDHHKTARDALAGLPFARFDMGKSGAMLAWEHFHSGEMPPRIVEFVQDRDLWTWELPRSREFSAALSIELRDFRHWDAIEESLRSDIGRETFLQRGEAILAAQSRQVERLADRPDWVEIAGHRIPAVNCPLYQSEIGEALCRLHPDAPFAAVWYEIAGRERWSLRSRNGFDVSAVAREMGGGGHPAAAGFERPRP